jgi:DNA-binding MarR family transcriptional regulator
VNVAGLTALHMLALGWIRFHPATFAADVAALLGIEESKAEQLLADLEAAGLIHAMTEQ